MEIKRLIPNPSLSEIPQEQEPLPNASTSSGLANMKDAVEIASSQDSSIGNFVSSNISDQRQLIDRLNPSVSQGAQSTTPVGDSTGDSYDSVLNEINDLINEYKSDPALQAEFPGMLQKLEGFQTKLQWEKALNVNGGQLPQEDLNQLHEFENQFAGNSYDNVLKEVSDLINEYKSNPALQAQFPGMLEKLESFQTWMKWEQALSGGQQFPPNDLSELQGWQNEFNNALQPAQQSQISDQTGLTSQTTDPTDPTAQTTGLTDPTDQTTDQTDLTPDPAATDGMNADPSAADSTASDPAAADPTTDPTALDSGTSDPTA